MELLVLQAVFVASLFVVTVTSALLPICWLWIKCTARSKSASSFASNRSGSDSEEIVDTSASASGGEFMSEPKVQKVMSAANAFSCGVFAAMVVISMIPGSQLAWEQAVSESDTVIDAESTEKIESVVEGEDSSSSHKMKFPWNGVVLLAGFTTFMALETILHSHGDTHNTPEKSDHKQQHQISSGSGGLPKLYPGNRGTRSSSKESKVDPGEHFTVVEEFRNFNSDYVSLNAMRDVDTSTEELAADYGSVQDYQQLNHSKADTKKPSEAILSKKQTSSQKAKQQRKSANIRRKSVSDGLSSWCDWGALFEKNPGLVTLVTAVTAHNLLEGTTLGLQDNGGSAVAVFTGIALHAAIFSFAVSVSVIKLSFESSSYVQTRTQSQGMKRVLSAAAVILTLACLARPFGVSLGVLITKLPGNSGQVVKAILTSFSTGIFMEITFISMIRQEFKSGEEVCNKRKEVNQISRRLKYVFMVAGILLISIVMTWMSKHGAM